MANTRTMVIAKATSVTSVTMAAFEIK